MKTEKELEFKDLFLPFTTKKALVFIIIIGLIVFFNGLFNGFVGDDKPLISANVAIQSLQNLPQFFMNSQSGHVLERFSYRPLTTTIFSVLYLLFGPSSFAYHLFLIIFYIINACLVFLFLKQFFQKPLAFILSLGFLLHPINSEVALYISDIQEVFFLFFGMLALVILSRFRSYKSIIFVNILLFLSLLAKETGILFYLIALLYIFIYHRKTFYRIFISFIFSSVTYSALRLFALGITSDANVLAPIHDLSLPGRLINIPAIIFFYLKTFLFPLDLAMSYHWVVTKINFSEFFLPLIFDISFLVVLIGGAFIIYRKFSRKYLTLYLFFTVWFLAGILMHLQIIPLDLTVSDRWFYFPIIGLLGMIGVLLTVYKINLGSKAVIIIIVSLLLLLSLRTFIRSFDWRDNFTLATHDLKISKQAYNLELILSGEYYNQKNFKFAAVHAQKSIALYPNPVSYTVLGLTYYNLGNYEQSRQWFLKALQYADFEVVYTNLAIISLSYGDKNNNISFIKNVALKKYPENAELWLCLAWLEYNNNDKDNAKTAIMRAYQLDKGGQTAAVYHAIMNNLPLKINTGFK